MKRKNLIISLVAIIASLAFSQCFPGMKFINGNGIIIEKSREIPSFTEVDVRGAFDVYVHQSDTNGISIQAESNIMPYIETYVSDGELIVKTPINFSINPSMPIVLDIYSTEVEKIKLSGSGLIDTDTIYTDNLEIKISGSGNIFSTFYGKSIESKISGSGDMRMNVYSEETELRISGSGDIEVFGHTDFAEFDISGSGKIYAEDFEIEEANVEVSGSGNMWLWVNDYLHARISGSGNIYLVGEPDEIDFKSSGSGELFYQ